jgi:hypothetical protein
MRDFTNVRLHPSFGRLLDVDNGDLLCTLSVAKSAALGMGDATVLAVDVAARWNAVADALDALASPEYDNDLRRMIAADRILSRALTGGGSE